MHLLEDKNLKKMLKEVEEAIKETDKAMKNLLDASDDLKQTMAPDLPISDIFSHILKIQGSK